jgi:hypothetical protein
MALIVQGEIIRLDSSNIKHGSAGLEVQNNQHPVKGGAHQPLVRGLQNAPALSFGALDGLLSSATDLSILRQQKQHLLIEAGA